MITAKCKEGNYFTTQQEDRQLLHPLPCTLQGLAICKSSYPRSCMQGCVFAIFMLISGHKNPQDNKHTSRCGRTSGSAAEAIQCKGFLFYLHGSKHACGRMLIPGSCRPTKEVCRVLCVPTRLKSGLGEADFRNMGIWKSVTLTSSRLGLQAGGTG